MDQNQEASWHLDKKVPVTLIIVLAVQLVGGGMMMARMEARITDAISTNIEQSDDIKVLRDEAQRMAVGAATVNAQLTSVRDSLTELKDAQRETNELLRNMAERGNAP